MTIILGLGFGFGKYICHLTLDPLGQASYQNLIMGNVGRLKYRQSIIIRSCRPEELPLLTTIG